MPRRCRPRPRLQRRSLSTSVTDTPEDFAELQRELIVDNTRDGIAAARARGRVGGRPTAMTPAKLARACELLEAPQLDGRRLTMEEIARTVGVSRRILYRALGREAGTDRG